MNCVKNEVQLNRILKVTAPEKYNPKQTKNSFAESCLLSSHQVRINQQSEVYIQCRKKLTERYEFQRF